MVAAGEEERFRRIKHWAGFPGESISYCLRHAGLKLDDVKHIAINTDPSANRVRRILYTLKNRISPKMIIARLKHRRNRADIEEELSRSQLGGAFRGKVHRVGHHM